MAKCVECGKDFEPRSVNMLFCCRKCQEANNRRLHGMKKEEREAVMARRHPGVTFACSQCGKVVVTEPGSGDRRTRFCCEACERKFWKHPHWENPSTRTNFRSLQECESYERRTNGRWGGC